MTAAADPRKLADTVREAHGHAMTALAADVHPISPGAIRDREAELDAALDALVSLAEQLQQERDEYREHAWTRQKVADRERAARESAEQERDEARLALEHQRERANANLATAERIEQRAMSAEADLRAAQARADELEKALRAEFFHILPDLDYEAVIPGSDDEDGMHPVFDWAWAMHPWFALLGLTRDECIAVLAASPQAGEHQAKETA